VRGFDPGGDYETPGVHHAAWRGSLAARGARAAAGDDGDRFLDVGSAAERVPQIAKRAGRGGYEDGRNVALEFRGAEVTTGTA
jgi:hypothetical protein